MGCGGESNESNRGEKSSKKYLRNWLVHQKNGNITFVFTLLRNLLGAVVAIFVVALVVPGISYQGDARVLIAAALVFALFQTLVKPILNLVALPLNFLTFGSVSVLIGVGLFYAISYLVSSFTFSPFEFSGFSFSALVVPAMWVPRYGTVIIGSVITSVVFALVSQPSHG